MGIGADVELVVVAIILAALLGIWLLGARRQRVAVAEQRSVLESLEGQRVNAEVVVGLVPMSKNLQLIASARLRLGTFHGTGHRIGVSDVHVRPGTGIDEEAVAARVERDGIDARDLVSVVTPDGERLHFGVVKEPNRRRDDSES